MKYSESEVMGIVRLDADEHECVLMRNNVGAFKTSSGRWVRYGLANESKAQNKHHKSSDFIGIRRVVITEDMVGTVIGQFVARECKHSGWKYTGTDEEEAQARFIELVSSYGGDAAFAVGKGTFSPKPTTRARRLEPTDRRTMILNGAYEVMRKAGTCIMLTQIAAHCGVSVSAIRHYFANRTVLFESVLAVAQEKGDATLVSSICSYFVRHGANSEAA